MSGSNKIVWSEGMFLRPQHFQQHDRYLERLIESRAGMLRPHAYGATSLIIDEQALSLGKLAIASARGVLPDGTPFDFPATDEPPTPLDLPEDLDNEEVLLALPLRREGLADALRAEDPLSLARYRISEVDVRDASADPSPGEGAMPVEVGQLRLKLMLASEDAAAYTTLGVALANERTAEGQISLDPNFVPPCLDYRASAVLSGYVQEIERLLRQKGDGLGGRVSEAGRGTGAAEFAEFLRLQVINRFEPLFLHYASTATVHPETIYCTAVQLAGELATFTRGARRPIEFPVYRHDALAESFAPVMVELRRALTEVEQPNAVPLPLEARRFGIHVAAVNDPELIKSASFILAVNAQMPVEKLRQAFPRQVKVGPRELIRQLVNAHLPGITVTALPVTPRQIPYHAGAIYFELDRGSDYWAQLESPGGFAFHVAGEFPGMEMEFWAIRE
ncbi:MAG: type VI secretion system baseplate subunit TssK [Gammaproteobacteria bacterium]